MYWWPRADCCLLQIEMKRKTRIFLANLTSSLSKCCITERPKWVNSTTSWSRQTVMFAISCVNYKKGHKIFCPGVVEWQCHPQQVHAWRQWTAKDNQGCGWMPLQFMEDLLGSVLWIIKVESTILVDDVVMISITWIIKVSRNKWQQQRCIIITIILIGS